MGKGEIACYEQFLLFPQCFQKACFPGASKGVIVWEWVKWKQFLQTGKTRAVTECDLILTETSILYTRQTHKRTDTQADSSIPPKTFVLQKYNNAKLYNIKDTISRTLYISIWCLQCRSMSTLSNKTNFRLFQNERVCRWQFQIWWKWQNILQKDRKQYGKRRNCSLRAISPFP